MGKELVISSNRHETKVAMLEDDQLVEIFFQRSNEYSLAGSIQKGRVTRVLPGMQSAFVDIGLDRDAFLYVTDFFEEQEEYDKMAGPPEDRGRRPERQPERQPDRQTARTVPPAPAPPAQAEPVTAAAPAPEDDRDRRNRRSRRRRSRGRGFPDSKYVALSSEPAPASERVTERVTDRDRALPKPTLPFFPASLWPSITRTHPRTGSSGKPFPKYRKWIAKSRKKWLPRQTWLRKHPRSCPRPRPCLRRPTNLCRSPRPSRSSPAGAEEERTESAPELIRRGGGSF